MASHGQQEPEAAAAGMSVARVRALDRLRAVFTVPSFISRWRERERAATDAQTATPDSTLTFFSLDDEDDEPRGEVTLYPMQIDSEDQSESTALSEEVANTSVHEPSSENSLEKLEGLAEADIEVQNIHLPLDSQDEEIPKKLETLAEAELEVQNILLPLDSQDEDMPKNQNIQPQKRMLLLPPAAGAAVVVRCVCWVLAQRVVRQFLEKVVGASQRWLFANVCSRRIRLAVIGVFSILWGMLIGALSICLLIVIIAGDLNSVVEEAATLGEWRDPVATTVAALCLVMHVAQVVFGALLIAASKVTGYRAPEESERLMERLLLALFELMKIDITPPPPAPCNHPLPSPSTSCTSSPRGSVWSGDGDSRGSYGTIASPPVIKNDPDRPSFIEPHPSFPSPSSRGPFIGWVRPEETERGNEGCKWPELPGAWKAPDFIQTSVSNPSGSVPAPNENPNSVPCTIPCPENPVAGPSKPPYPVSNNLPYPLPNYFLNPVVSDPPYPEPSNAPYPTYGGGHPMGFQPPPCGFPESASAPLLPDQLRKQRSSQSSAVKITKYSVKVKILNRKRTIGSRPLLPIAPSHIPQKAPREQESSSSSSSAEEERVPEQMSRPSPVPHMLMPWLYTAWMTLGLYALLSTGLAALNCGGVAAAVGAVELPAVACVVDVFAELRGVPESCGCKETRKRKNEKTKEEIEVNLGSTASPVGKVKRDYNESSPLLP